VVLKKKKKLGGKKTNKTKKKVSKKTNPHLKQKKKKNPSKNKLEGTKNYWGGWPNPPVVKKLSGGGNHPRPLDRGGKKPLWGGRRKL